MDIRFSKPPHETPNSKAVPFANVEVEHERVFVGLSGDGQLSCVWATEQEARALAAKLIERADELADVAAEQELAAEQAKIDATKRRLDEAYGSMGWHYAFSAPGTPAWCGTTTIATWLVKSGLTVTEEA